MSSSPPHAYYPRYFPCQAPPSPPQAYPAKDSLEMLNILVQRDEYTTASMINLIRIAQNAGMISETTYLCWQPYFGLHFQNVCLEDVPGIAAWSYHPEHKGLALFFKTIDSHGMPHLEKFMAGNSEKNANECRPGFSNSKTFFHRQEPENLIQEICRVLLDPMEVLKTLSQLESSHQSYSMIHLFKIAQDSGMISKETYIPWQERFGVDFETLNLEDISPRNIAWSYNPRGGLALFLLTASARIPHPDCLEKFTSSATLLNHDAFTSGKGNSELFSSWKPYGSRVEHVRQILQEGFVKGSGEPKRMLAPRSPLEFLEIFLPQITSYEACSMANLFKIALEAGKISNANYIPWREKNFAGMCLEDIPGNVAWSYDRGELALLLKREDIEGPRLEIFTTSNFFEHASKINADPWNSESFSPHQTPEHLLQKIRYFLEKQGSALSDSAGILFMNPHPQAIPLRPHPLSRVPALREPLGGGPSYA